MTNEQKHQIIEHCILIANKTDRNDEQMEKLIEELDWMFYEFVPENVKL